MVGRIELAVLIQFLQCAYVFFALPHFVGAYEDMTHGVEILLAQKKLVKSIVFNTLPPSLTKHNEFCTQASAPHVFGTDEKHAQHHIYISEDKSNRIC